MRFPQHCQFLQQTLIPSECFNSKGWETLKSYCTCCWARRFQTTQTVKRIKKTQHTRKVLRVLSRELPFSPGQSGREARLLQRSEKARTRAHRADWSGLTLPSLTAEVRERWGRRQPTLPESTREGSVLPEVPREMPSPGLPLAPRGAAMEGGEPPCEGARFHPWVLGVRRSRAPNSVASVKKIEQQRVQPVVQKSTSINRNSPPLSHPPWLKGGFQPFHGRDGSPLVPQRGRAGLSRVPLQGQQC